MTLKVKRLDPAAKLPVRTTSGASCFDIHALEGGTIPAKSRGFIRTGIAVAVEKGFEVQVRSRSGLALKQGIFVLNSPGTVDSDYRGEVGIILMNLGDDIFTYKAGDRIAQLGVYPVVMCDAQLVDSLDDTARSAGGFGSTGR
ncbi:MAG: dUTP diphosphatase [Nibricoccus sp.]